jgi:hypothetical protein
MTQSQGYSAAEVTGLRDFRRAALLEDTPPFWPPPFAG